MMARRKRSKWLWFLALVTLGGIVFFLARRSIADQAPIDSSLVVTIKRAELAIEILEVGKVLPREKVELKSKVAGQVSKVLVDEGMQVTQGQLLLELDPTDYQREVARAETEVAQAKNALDFAKLNVERKQAGVAGNVTPAFELDVASFDRNAKRVALRAAHVALATAQDRVRYTKIASPIAGTVIQRGIEPGEVVTPGIQSTFDGKALLTVADLSTLVVKIDLNQIDVAKVRLGHSATLTLDALPAKTYSATITKIAPASVKPPGKDVEVFPVEAEIAVADGLIKPGMSADVRIHIDAKPSVLSLPIEAVVKQDGKSFVTRIIDEPDGKKRTEKIEVTPGARNDRNIEIVSGIEENDRILIQPASSAENETKL